MALVMLPFWGARLAAQEISPLQNWPTDDSYGRQYQQNQQYTPQPQYGTAQYPPQYQPPQAGYAQQGYPQQQAYADTSQYSNGAYPQQGYQQTQGLNAEQLEQIVAPIALYPDNLLAQVLAASTYPAQVSAADQWLRMHGNAPAEQIVAGADAQTGWDPSVKALTAFPQVLAEMARNLQWTTDLGNAYYNQPQDVMQTVQVMRDRAEAAGNLQSTPQQQVTVDQGNIELAPADAQTVYVPSYDPWAVYGQPVSPYPGFSLLDSVGSFLGSSPIQFGLGIAMQAFSSTPWGWLGWGLDWLAHSVLFNNGDYFTHSGSVADWGFAHGGPRAYRGGWDRAGNRDGGGWGRGNAPRPRPGFDGGRQGFGRQGERYGNGWNSEGYNRGYRSYDGGRAAQEAYNRMPQAIGRPQQYGGRSQFFEGRSQGYGDRFGAFGRPGYGSGMYGRQQGNNFGGRPSANPVYHSPESGFRGNSGGRSFGSYGGEYGGGQARSGGGGFHFFGHSHDSQGFSGGSRGFGGNSFGGHSSRGFGGFGGGGYKAPKAGHFGGGGGHFGGGGGHSGGGHSGGGHGGGGGHGHHH